MKKSYIICTLILFFFSKFSIAGGSLEGEIMSGLEDVYNLRFDDAERKFRSIQSSYPNELSGYFYESLLSFYDALPSRKDEPFNKFLKQSSDVIEKADKILEKDERNYDAMYFKGMSHSYRSLLMLSLNKNLLEAASDGNSGYRTLNELVKLKPDYYDAYMGLGLYKIALGFVPDKFKWLLSLIGFDGDIRNGVELLRNSMNKGKFTRVDSKVFLSIFSLDEREQNDNRAVELSAQLVADYPQSSVFRVFHASLLLQSGKTNEAIEEANTALSMNTESFKDEITKSASAVLGNAYFRLSDFSKAAQYLESFMKYANHGDRLNVHMFTMGISYELLGDRSKAVETYKRVRKDFINERDGEVDKFFYRYAQERIASPLRQFEKDMIEGLNLRESGNVDGAIEKYETMMKNNEHMKSGKDDDKIRLHYNLGLAYSYKGNKKEAEKQFMLCLKLEPETETWLVPHSYFELGKIYYDGGSRKAAEEMFEKISDFDDFDFETFLDMRISNFKNRN